MAALSPEYRRAWMAEHPVYGSWRSMLCLCGIKRGAHERDRKYYEGIGIYEDWLDYKTFESWAMSNGWKKGLMLARRDKNLDFCPENCEWTTKEMNNGWRRNIMRYSDGRSIRDVMGYENLGRDNREHQRLGCKLRRLRRKTASCESGKVISSSGTDAGRGPFAVFSLSGGRANSSITSSRGCEEACSVSPPVAASVAGRGTSSIFSKASRESGRARPGDNSCHDCLRGTPSQKSQGGL